MTRALIIAACALAVGACSKPVQAIRATTCSDMDYDLAALHSPAMDRLMHQEYGTPTGAGLVDLKAYAKTVKDPCFREAFDHWAEFYERKASDQIQEDERVALAAKQGAPYK